MKEELVSIVTPAYNAAKHIGETIESVISQTYQNWEMIVVNDCSTDNTLEIINSYCKIDNRIKVINLIENKGAANAWNEAFRIMNGRFVAFLDSDDLWVNTKLEEQTRIMIRNKYYFTYGSYDWIDKDGKAMNKIINIPKKMNYKNLLKNTNIGLLTVMIDRKEIKITSIDVVYMDWDLLLWTLILKKGYIAYGIPKIIAHYRILDNSASRNKKKAALGVWNIYKNHLDLNLCQRSYYFFCYAINSIKRYYLK